MCKPIFDNVSCEGTMSDPNATSLMDDVVEVLTLLLNMKDMASSSLHHQVVQFVHSSHHPRTANRNG